MTLRRLQQVVPWAVIVAAVLLACGYLYMVNHTAFRYVIPESLNSCLQQRGAGGRLDWKQIQACEDQASVPIEDIVKAPVEELKWILEIIGTLAAFFVVVQGAAAYFSAEAYKDRADKLLAQMNDAVDQAGQIRRKLRKHYPLFGELEEARSTAFETLEKKVSEFSRGPSSQPTEALRENAKRKLYSSMNTDERQKILSLESFASIDLHQGRLSDKEWSEHLRRYAYFYQSKFVYEGAINSASFGDLERAEGYLRLAQRTTPGDFTLVNDLGVVCLDILQRAERSRHNEPPGRRGPLQDLTDKYRRTAIDLFGRSLAMQPSQQRAHYNRAIIYSSYSMPKMYSEASRELEKAIDQCNWQESPSPGQFKALLRYNLGCYRARVVVQENPSGSFAIGTPGVAKCIEALEAAVDCGKKGIEVDVKTIEKDFGPDGAARNEGRSAGPPEDDGDVVRLYRRADETLRSKLAGIKDALLRAARRERDKEADTDSN